MSSAQNAGRSTDLCAHSGIEWSGVAPPTDSAGLAGGFVVCSHLYSQAIC